MRRGGILAKLPPMPSRPYHWPRRAAQLGTIALFALIPATGLFRIDLVAGVFFILNRQTCWSDFFLMFGAMAVIATAPLLTYSTIGRIWCGWACPQNTISEWADKLTRKLLGKRASVDVASNGLQVASAKNKAINWIILTASFLGMSLVLGIVPFLYFFPPEQVWALLTFGLDSQLSRFMHPLYLVSVVAIFLDIAVIRYFWCDYACLYRVGQFLFKTQDALHVEYDAARSSACVRCNYCAASCLLAINPTDPVATETCINCGECIDACNRLQQRNGGSGLLHFEFGKERRSHGLAAIGAMVAKFNWVGVIFLIGCAMIGWAMFHYSPHCWR
jgi:polyferredoxin